MWLISLPGITVSVIHPPSKYLTSASCMKAEGGVSACFVWPPARGQRSAPRRFHGAGSSVRGIKDEASWRMARLLLLARSQFLYTWQQGSKTWKHCTSRRYAPLPLSPLFLPSLQAADGGACAISMARCLTSVYWGPAGTHVVKRHTEETQQHNLKLMKHVCWSAWVCVHTLRCQKKRQSLIKH